MKKSQVYYLADGGDEQYTPRCGVEILLPHIQHLKDKTIWCPFDREDSQFVKVLSDNGFTVVYSHLDSGQDFFSYEPEHWDALISNPPYHNKRQFFQRCLDFNKPFALLLPINILSDGIINEKLKGRESDLSLLIPNKRMRFYNRKTGAIGNSPTFKAAYIGVGIFLKPIILQDMEVSR